MIWTIAVALSQAEPPLDPGCPQGDLAFVCAPGSVCVGRLTEGYQFSAIWPAEAAAIPALDRLLRRDAAGSERWIATETSRYRREMAQVEAKSGPAHL